MIGRIEIGVITDPRRQLHRTSFCAMKDAAAQAGIVAQNRGLGREQLLQITSRVFRQAGRPRARNAFNESSSKKHGALEIPESENDPASSRIDKIENEFADCNADSRRARGRLENSKWKILNRKMRIGRDFDEGSEQGGHSVRGGLVAAQIFPRFVEATTAK